MKSETFFVEVTDTFGGEANYSWVRRYKVPAKTFLGAAQKVSKETGISWRKVSDSGDFKRYDSRSGCSCFFIELFDADTHENEKFTDI